MEGEGRGGKRVGEERGRDGMERKGMKVENPLHQFLRTPMSLLGKDRLRPHFGPPKKFVLHGLVAADPR